MRPIALPSEAKKHLWRQLAGPDNKIVLYLAECYFHAVEAYVAVERTEQMGELEFFVLKAARLFTQPDLHDLNSVLHVGTQVLRQIVNQFVRDGLLSEESDGRFRMTPQGRVAAESGRVVKLERTRVLFHFTYDSNEYVRVRDATVRKLRDMRRHETPGDWHFEASSIAQCIGQSEEWKRIRGFPSGIVRLLTAEDDKSANEQLSLEADGNRQVDLGRGQDTESTEQFLIVNKAQVAHCAMAVTFSGSVPTGLKAYILPVSEQHTRGHDGLLFSLEGPESVLQAFPAVAASPSRQQINDAWQSLGELHGLQGMDRAVARLEEGRMAIGVTNKQVLGWLALCWNTTKGEVFCDMTLAEANRLCGIALHGKNPTSSRRLQEMQLLFKLAGADDSEFIPRDAANRGQWLSERDFLVDLDIYALASLAWELGEFKLAYRVAELEDMADARVPDQLR